MFTRHSLFGLVLGGVVGLTPTLASAWKEGNHAKDWTKGATIKVFVDPVPAGAPAGTAGAVTEAIKEWNDAQAKFGGLTLMTAGADKTNSEIHISWGKLADLGAGITEAKKDADPGFTKTTVKVKIPFDGGLNDRGITRILKHELGHAEGLGHSAKSDLMREDAYTSKPGEAPTVADVNSAAAFTPPTDDDKAGKNTLWGTKEKLSISEAASTVTPNGPNFIYDYNLHALNQPGLTDPVTEFTMEMHPGIGESDFTVTGIPTGWHSHFFSGDVAPGGLFNDNESPAPSLLSFMADSPSHGVQPGQTVHFDLTSPFGPGNTRAFTNSPSFDSNVFTVASPVPEPSVSLLFLGGLSMLWFTFFIRERFGSHGGSGIQISAV